MTLVPVPGFGAGDLGKEGNLAAYIDRALLEGHIWKQAKVYDPEGILSTIPSIATTLCGVLTGHLLRSRRTPVEKTAAMFVAGAACIVVDGRGISGSPSTSLCGLVHTFCSRREWRCNSSPSATG